MKLHGFEIASLANLAQEDTEVEEVTALIPSLSRFEERQIDEMLNVIRRCGGDVKAAAEDDDKADEEETDDFARADEDALDMGETRPAETSDMVDVGQ